MAETWWFYLLCNRAMAVALRLLADWEVTGLENVPARGPLILVANHNNIIDPPLLGASIPHRQVVFMAKKELFDRWYSGWLVRGYCAFPVRRGEPDRQAFRQALTVLRRGFILGMFPEGTRSKTGAMGPAQPGTAIIALRAGVPILPVGIIGTGAIKGPASVIRHRPRIVVNIGRPFGLVVDRADRRRAVEEATRQIMGRIAALLPAECWGPWTPLPDPAPLDTHAR
jgi:1-acyl-sn-glycerol-3-phosphate acyltransferase